MYKKHFKRVIDVMASLIVLCLTLILIIPIIFVLTVANRGTPFFTQLRPGRDGRVFKVIKFKTMNDRRGPDGELLPDVERLNRLGSALRKTSLDELPQLINVLKGDMSLIGPRPLLVEYLPLYSSEQARRHEVRPGITGWAQVNGRNAIGWQEKFKLDVWYVDNISFGIDLRILLLTVFRVLKSDGVAQEGQATVEYFNGTN